MPLVVDGLDAKGREERFERLLALRRRSGSHQRMSDALSLRGDVNRARATLLSYRRTAHRGDYHQPTAHGGEYATHPAIHHLNCLGHAGQPSVPARAFVNEASRLAASHGA